MTDTISFRADGVLLRRIDAVVRKYPSLFMDRSVFVRSAVNRLLLEVEG